MTARARATLKTAFENGDVPDEDDYEDLIDSSLNLTDSSAQTMTSKLTVSGGLETTTVSAVTVRASSCTLTGSVTANSVSTPLVCAANISVGTLSANSIFGSTGLKTVAMGVGTAAPSEGVQIVVSGDSNLRLDIATTVVASAGVSGPATPTSVAGFFPVVINGVRRLVAFYNVA
jgi:hypothetical protein